MRLVLTLLLLLAACGSPEAQRAEVRAALDDGQEVRAEDLLSAALERWPEDVPLLLAGVELYLRAGETHKPRLALHYAMRAFRAAPEDPAVFRSLERAREATGGYARTPEGAELLRRGLEQVEQERAANQPGQDLAPSEAVH